MASIDLSLAFDIVNVELIIERMKIIGIPDDVVSLVKNYNCYFYNGENGSVNVKHVYCFTVLIQ